MYLSVLRNNHILPNLEQKDFRWDVENIFKIQLSAYIYIEYKFKQNKLSELETDVHLLYLE